jgi:hypothetical protein
MNDPPPLNDIHEKRSIWQRLVGVICSLLNLAPHKISDRKVTATSTKTTKDLRSIKHNMNGISNLWVQDEAKQIVEDIEVRLQMCVSEVNSLTGLVDLSGL